MSRKGSAGAPQPGHGLAKRHGSSPPVTTAANDPLTQTVLRAVPAPVPWPRPRRGDPSLRFHRLDGDGSTALRVVSGSSGSS